MLLSVVDWSCQSLHDHCRKHCGNVEGCLCSECSPDTNLVGLTLWQGVGDAHIGMWEDVCKVCVVRVGSFTSHSKLLLVHMQPCRPSSRSERLFAHLSIPLPVCLGVWAASAAQQLLAPAQAQSSARLGPPAGRGGGFDQPAPLLAEGGAGLASFVDLMVIREVFPPILFVQRSRQLVDLRSSSTCEASA